MNKTLTILLLCLLSTPALSSVEIDMRLLSEKAGLCEAELNRGKKGGHCESFLELDEYIFKGSASAYISYHFDNGTINDTNSALFMKTLEKNTEILQRIYESGE